MITPDVIRRFGRVNVSPNDIGDKIEFATDDEWMGHGFVSSSQPFLFSGYHNPRNYCIGPDDAGFHDGDAGAALVKVVSDDSIPPVVGVHDGSLRSFDVEYSTAIDKIQALLGYKEVTYIATQGQDLRKDELRNDDHISHRANIKGVPHEYLPDDAIIIPPGADDKDVLQWYENPDGWDDPQILYVKGIPYHLLPPDAQIIT